MVVHEQDPVVLADAVLSDALLDHFDGFCLTFGDIERQLRLLEVLFEDLERSFWILEQQNMRAVAVPIQRLDLALGDHDTLFGRFGINFLFMDRGNVELIFILRDKGLTERLSLVMRFVLLHEVSLQSFRNVLPTQLSLMIMSMIHHVASA